MIGCIQQITGVLTDVHTFTLLFRSGAIAVLQVHGAENLEEARASACCALPKTCYEVIDGDLTHGQAEVFHTHLCAEEGKTLLRSLSDVELEQMCLEVEATIDRLSAIDEKGQLTEQEELQLDEALRQGEILELEQIRRLVRNVAWGPLITKKLAGLLEKEQIYGLIEKIRFQSHSGSAPAPSSSIPLSEEGVQQ